MNFAEAITLKIDLRKQDTALCAGTVKRRAPFRFRIEREAYLFWNWAMPERAEREKYFRQTVSNTANQKTAIPLRSFGLFIVA